MHHTASFRLTHLVSSIAVALTGLMLPLQSQAADEDVEKLYKEGLYLRETGKPYSAIETLENILATQPTLQRVRLELAVAYYRTMNYERARAEAQKVLEHPDTPDNVRLSVSTFLAQLKKDEEDAKGKAHTVEPFVSVGFIADSNVNAGPGSDVLPGGLVLLPGATALSDNGATLQAGVSHTYQSPTPVRIGETAARFLWKTQASAYHRGYFEEDAYDLTSLTVATGPAWMAPKKWRANVNFQVDYLMLGGNELAWYLSAAPSFTLQTHDGEVTFDALYVNRDFTRAVDQGRDSDYWAAAVSYGHIFQGGKVAGQVGARLFDETADTNRFSNHGIEMFAAANFVAWKNGNLFVRYSRKEANYDGVEPIFNLGRGELENRYELGFGHNFKEGALKDWRLSGSWLKTDTQANVAIYDYVRDVVTLNLGRTF